MFKLSEACFPDGTPAMSPQHKVIQMSSLKRAESIYRTRLANEPGDSTARVKLAWCLFMEAIYRAGQESMLAALCTTVNLDDEQRSKRMQLIWDQDADQLLNDCLQQTTTVMEISSDPWDRKDVERIKALVKLSGVRKAVSDAEEEAARIQAAILSDILKD
jgi:hypothetical protein